MSVNPADRKLIQNEATQRLENSHVKRTLEPIIGPATKISFICECSDLDCRDRIDLTSDEFDSFHVQGKRFVVKPNHEIVAIEKIISRTDDYYIVEKYEDPLKLATDYKA
ncbi:hypothetical protein BH09PAT3_BH09PAT3_1760 [soil metagenome]